MVRRSQALGRQMRVYLGGGEARMPEHLLDAAQIRTSREHIGRERVAHVMRRIARAEPCTLERLLEHEPDGIL